LKTARRFALALDPTDYPATSTLGDWYANLLNIGSARWVLCLNERSLLPVLVPARKSEFPESFPDHLGAVLSGIGIPTDLVFTELALSSDFRFGKTKNRQVLGSLNDFAFSFEHRLRDQEDPLKTTLALARMPCSPLPLVFPDRTVFALFGLADAHRPIA
jgi:hypothetical protein